MRIRVDFGVFEGFKVFKIRICIRLNLDHNFWKYKWKLRKTWVADLRNFCRVSWVQLNI